MTTRPLITPRGALFIARADQVAAVHALHEQLRSEGTRACLLDSAAARARVPVLREAATALALLDDDSADIDVDRLHQRFLRGARQHGAPLFVNADVQAIEFSAGRWQVSTATQQFTAALLVNAAGAWADSVAALAGVARSGCSRAAAAPSPSPRRRAATSRLALHRRHRRNLLLQARRRRAARLTSQCRPGAAA